MFCQNILHCMNIYLFLRRRRTQTGSRRISWRDIVKIIIIGCGKVGETLAAVLSQEGNDITIIDKREEVVESLCNEYDIMGVVGNGASYSEQREADIEHADLMIAVTGSDELNLLCCLIAKKAGNCHTIARVRNPEYNSELRFIQEELGLALVINQELAAAMEIARVLKFPSAIEIDTFAKGRVELLRFKIPEGSILDDLTLNEMHNKIKCSVLVCAVERSGEILIPKGDDTLKSGDVISIVATVKDQGIFFNKIGIHTNRVRNVMIVGGGEIAYYLGKMLTSAGIQVKILEKKLERCEELCEMLPKATIIHGDGTNKHLLEEEGISGTEGFVALTDFDEENVILSLYAKKCGCRKIVTKINRFVFEEVIDSLELDTTIYPRDITAEYILQYVRAMKNSIGCNIETLHRIIDNKAEALEFIVRDNFQMKDITLQELPIKPGILVACINRNGQIILPRGRDVMQEGDTVVVITAQKGLNDINDIFQGR